jgi:hypothetical protein
MSTAHDGTRKRILAVRSVTTKLHEVEEAIDLAIIKMCELNSELPSARLKANLSATVAQPAFDLAAEALRSLILSRKQTVEAHQSLAQTQRDMGLGAQSMGEGWKIFKNELQVPLTLVASEAA